MASKEVKTSLKKARDAIRNKEYKEALKNCKAVLKLDKTNYNALVFIGVCAGEMGQSDQAQAAYKRAVESEPDQLLAWQGLASLYEKDKTEPRFVEELPEVYSKLSQLYESSDKVKWKEVNLKLCELYVQQQGQVLKGVEIMEELIKSSEEDQEQYALWHKIAVMLEKQGIEDPEITLKLKKAYEHLINEEWTSRTDIELEMQYMKYIQLLLRLQIDENGEVDRDGRNRVLAQCEAMMVSYPNSKFPMEVIGKLYLEETPTICGDQAPDIYRKLCHLDPHSGIGKVGLGWSLLKAKDINHARQYLEAGLQSFPKCPAGWFYLAHAQLSFHDYASAEQSSRKGLDHLVSVPGTHTKIELERCLSLKRAEALYRQGGRGVDEAREIYEQLLSETAPDDPEVLIGLGETSLMLGENKAATEYCSKALDVDKNFHPALAVQGKISFKEGYFDDAELRYLEAIELSNDTALYYFLLGQLYWEMNGNLRADKSKCLAQFLKAAKLDPFYSPTFLYLGHYYRSVLKDLTKACRCYQKSFDLNPEHEEAGSNLGDLLAQLGDEDAALRLFTHVTGKAVPGEAKWAWIRLGLYHLRHDESNEAITCFQNTLRADPKDRHCWECLGEAYICRGSYTASLKAFTRASELDSSSAYCLYQMAAIKQLLCVYSEAIKEYQLILDKQPDYVPALKGLGEAHLCLARSSLAQDFNGRAVDHIRKALTALARAAECRPHMSCLWKLIGDCCTVLHPVASCAVNISLPENLRKFIGGDGATLAGKKEVLYLGTSAYGRALKALPECASLWNDLGFSYFLQAKIADEIQRKRLALRAVEVLKKGLTIEPSNHKLWNTLGVVCASPQVNNAQLSQHAFIMSIKTEPNNVVAWTNLGVLYLKHGKVEPAHEAFKNAQALEPSYTAAWVGQASIAETIGSEEAIDLFRHTTELDSHGESSIGYAHWVCTRLTGDKSTEIVDGNSPVPTLSHLPTGYRKAVLQASAAMTKYTDRVRGIAGAYNMHGLLLEHQCLWQQAEHAYARAASLLEESDAKQELLNIVYVNHARVLCSLGRYTTSITQYQKVKSLTSFYDVCGLALAFYMAGKLTESYQSYEQALQLAASDADTSCALTAMGMLGYALDDKAGAKALLFKSSQLSSPCERGLMALCALGLVDSDLTLAGAALGELMKLGGEGKKDLSAEICYLFSRFYAIQGNQRLGLRHIVKAIHRHPDRVVLWNQLSAFILQVCPDDLQAAARCAEVTVKLKPVGGEIKAALHPASLVGSGSLPATSSSQEPVKNATRSSEEPIKNATSSAQEPIKNATSSSQEPAKNATSSAQEPVKNAASRTTAALRASQKAVRAYPDHVTSWAVLSAAVTAHGVAMETIGKGTHLHQLALGLSLYVTAKANEEKSALQVESQSQLPALLVARTNLVEAVQTWTVLHTGYCMMHSGFTQDALQQCDKALAVYASVPQMSTSLHFLKAQLSLVAGEPVEVGLNSLQASVLSSPHHSPHAWQVVAQVQSTLGSPMAAELCYRQCLQAGSSKKSTSWRLVPLIRLALLALTQAQCDVTGRDRWLSLCNEASTEVIKLDPDCSAARLIQGVAYYLQGNVRSARRFLKNAADSMTNASSVAQYWLQVMETNKQDNAVDPFK